MTPQFSKICRLAIFPLLILVAWFALVRYTFNTKPDLNGDNIHYYIYASSMASGHGYADLSAPGAPATSNFPPGYPLLMTPLRMITDSIVAQKWLNEIFVLGAILLLYFALLRMGLPMGIAFTAAFAGLFCPRLLHFSTMMMSEASFLFTSMLALYAMVRMAEDESSWYSELRRPWLYVMIIAVVLTYHIRTQGLALIAGVLFCLLVRRRWGALLTTAGGFVLGCLPWIVRNRLLGLNGNRYMDMIMVANPWRPEAGTLSLGEFVARFFGTMKMLLFSAIPNTVIPYVDVNPDQPVYTVGLYVLGVILLAFMLYGCYRVGKQGWMLFGYVGATICLISMFSTPSGNRYITSLLPLLQALLLIGVWGLLTWLIQRRWPSVQFPAYALLLLLLLARPALEFEHKVSTQKYPVQYQQFFRIGRQLKTATPEGTVICSRKPQMMYMYSRRPGVYYKFTTNAEELILDLVDKQVDVVILDALGYSSTGLYLYPAMQRYPQYFPRVLMRYDDTHMYVLSFDRERAQRELARGVPQD